MPADADFEILKAALSRGKAHWPFCTGVRLRGIGLKATNVLYFELNIPAFCDMFPCRLNFKSRTLSYPQQFTVLLLL